MAKAGKEKTHEPGANVVSLRRGPLEAFAIKGRKLRNEIRALAEQHTDALDFLSELRSFERAPAWKLAGHATFVDFLHENFPEDPRVDHYRSVSLGFETYDAEVVRMVGIKGASYLTRKKLMDDPYRRGALHETLKALSRSGKRPTIARLRRLARTAIDGREPVALPKCRECEAPPTVGERGGAQRGQYFCIDCGAELLEPWQRRPPCPRCSCEALDLEPPRRSWSCDNCGLKYRSNKLGA